MSDVIIDSGLFFKRVEKIFAAWEKPSADTQELKDLSSLQILMGEPNEEASTYSKTASLQTYLLGYEFPSTLILLTRSPKKATFVCSSSKAKILRQLQSTGGIEIDIKAKGKDAESAQILPDLVLSLGDGKIGHLPKDKPQGKLVEELNNAVSASKASLEMVDIASAVAAILAVKDGDELKNEITGAKMTSTCMIHYLKTKMESLLDRGTKISHEDLAGLVEEKIGNDSKAADMKLWSKNAQLGDVDFTSTDWVYTPIIQSGGKYDLKASAFSNTDPLKPGIILASLGIRYKNYCTSMGRSFLISPQESQEKNYSMLLEVRLEAMKLLKAGAVIKDVYNTILESVKAKRPKSADYFVKNIGFGTGIEYRDSAYILGPKNAKQLKENMILTVIFGLADLPDPTDKKKTYSLLLSDTVKVGQEGAAILTDGCTKTSDVVMDMEESEPAAPAKKEKEAKSKSNGKSPVKTRTAPVGGKVLAAKTRGAQGGKQAENTTAERIKAHQAELHAQRKAEGLKKWEGGNGGDDDSRRKVIKKYESYKREEQLPKYVEERRIYVDEARQTVVVPVYGYATPFHISTIKNVTKNEEADYVVLRINFQTPGQIAGKKEDMPFEDPDATFLRSATFRSRDHRHMLKIYETITAAKKAAVKRESERKEMADVIEQEKLIEMKGRSPYALKNVYPRPALEGKKSDGTLEIHQNGLRYRPDGPAQKIDLLFSNIKHLFYQPSEKELIVLLHVHLKSPIIVGKKKTYDMQFYREASDIAFDDTTNGKRRKARYGDEDEIEQEQEDRKRRQELDKLFLNFAKRITDAAQAQQYELEVDVPFRELAFHGVPYRTDVLLQPTTDCLVHLSEAPFTIITLNEVEIVHFERVQFGLKAFDMVFVMSDFKKAPIHVNNVPVVHLDNVKEWLDSVDIPISEGPVNLSWPQIMKTLNDSPYEFYADGGWGFLTGDGTDDESDESSEESAFSAESGFDGSSDSDSESDFDDDASADSGSEDDDDDVTDGEDWDDLERKAARADDKRRDKDGDSSDDGKKKKKGGRR
ncbi:FACT complex subunit SPT16, partial [Tremellales sp. Uapishka_1]